MLLITYERKWLKSLLNEGFSLFFLYICGIIKIMNYRDYIWDLGGTLLDNYETSTNAFVATLKDFQIRADHDSVYAALKISTQDAIQLRMRLRPMRPTFRIFERNTRKKKPWGCRIQFCLKAQKSCFKKFNHMEVVIFWCPIAIAKF